MHPYIAVPAIGLLLLRAYRKNSLTPAGLVVAALSAAIHAIHPWSVFFTLLGVFFLGGTFVTKLIVQSLICIKVKHDIKARLTLSSSGASGGEGPRTHVQVLANSVVASVLILLHYRQLLTRKKGLDINQACWPYGEDLLVIGIVSNYAAVSADTFSSELGILSKSKPRLLTSMNFREVPPGTNGGVTFLGTMAGFLGAFTIAVTSAILLPFCPVELHGRNSPGIQGGSGWGWLEKLLWVLAVTFWGGLGSLLDSALGGWLQASVIDIRTGKIIEGAGGKKVLTVGLHKGTTKKYDEPSRKIESGVGILDNNAVNLLMAFLMSIGGMILTSYLWNAPFPSIFA